MGKQLQAREHDHDRAFSELDKQLFNCFYAASVLGRNKNALHVSPSVGSLLVGVGLETLRPLKRSFNARTLG